MRIQIFDLSHSNLSSEPCEDANYCTYSDVSFNWNSRCSAGIVMIAMVLQSVGLPVKSIALVASVDQIFDMDRTTVSITGDT